MNTQDNEPTMQNSDYKWFLDNFDNLFKNYGLCFLAIKNKNVLGHYKTYSEAVYETIKKEELGSFIVQKCSDNKILATNAFIYTINF